MHLATKLRVLRAALHLNQDDMAAAALITQRTLSYWENGIYYPKPVYIERLGNFLGVSADWLCNDEASFMVLVTKTEKGKLEVKPLSTALLNPELMAAGAHHELIKQTVAHAVKQALSEAKVVGRAPQPKALPVAEKKKTVKRKKK